MSNRQVTNPTQTVSRQDLADFYDEIFPYLGGKASAGFTPVGTIISVMGVTAPANYLACDGTVYNIADYPELAAYFGQQFSMVNKFGGNGTTTFAVPDLRGEFLRGTGTNSHSGNGNGANVGTHQDATRIPKFAVVGSSSSSAMIQVTSDDSTYKGTTNYEAANGTVTHWSNVFSDSSGTQTGTDATVTARPTNTSVLYCIATKNIYMNPSLDYSTDEKVVGSWIDGSTIYQRTFTGTTSSTAYTEATIGTLSSVDKVINLFGIVVSSNMKLPIEFVYQSNASSSNTIGCFILGEKIQVITSNYTNKTCYVTIQYTKTT